MNNLNDVLQLNFETELLNEINKVGLHRSFDEGQVIIHYNDEMSYLPLVVSGAIRVFRQDNEGHELLLYYLEPGDTCSTSISCCLKSSKSLIRAEAEKKTELIFIPVQLISEWIVKYERWRTFIFENYEFRFEELLSSIDQLAFMDLPKRTLTYLRNKVIANRSPNLKSTHQEIANELNTSRVVISRILKKLEQENKIKLTRSNIEVLDF